MQPGAVRPSRQGRKIDWSSQLNKCDGAARSVRAEALFRGAAKNSAGNEPRRAIDPGEQAASPGSVRARWLQTTAGGGQPGRRCWRFIMIVLKRVLVATDF